MMQVVGLSSHYRFSGQAVVLAIRAVVLIIASLQEQLGVAARCGFGHMACKDLPKTCFLSTTVGKKVSFGSLVLCPGLQSQQ